MMWGKKIYRKTFKIHNPEKITNVTNSPKGGHKNYQNDSLDGWKCYSASVTA